MRGVKFGGGSLPHGLFNKNFTKYFADRQDLSSSFQTLHLSTISLLWGKISNLILKSKLFPVGGSHETLEENPSSTGW